MTTGYAVEIDGYQLVQPLASSSLFQSFLATKAEATFRIVRFLRSANLLARAGFVDAVESTRRSVLVAHKNILPISIVEDSENTLVTATPFCPGPNLNTRKPYAEEILPTLLDLAEALAATHRIGVAHARLQTNYIYWTTNSIAIDLLDGSLGSNANDQRVGAIALARDVHAFGIIIRELSKSSLLPTQDLGRVITLAEEMIQSEWANRPSVDDVVDRLQFIVTSRKPTPVPLVPTVTSSSLSSDTFSNNVDTGNDATQEIPQFASESRARELMVPGNMPELGRFSIERSLGEGGMGAVFLGRDRSNNELVAIKVLSERMAKDEKASRRFAKEAR
ncbi:MAG TPA: hypothetical protein VM260_10165, partial [Pirellula sp.]|nr:hypothetical protein [Pirellula sp.]